MKTELTIPEHFPLLKEENLKVIIKRREDYARNRDIQAAELNQAIRVRQDKDKEKEKESQESS
jgi:hypothetical protein